MYTKNDAKLGHTFLDQVTLSSATILLINEKSSLLKQYLGIPSLRFQVPGFQVWGLNKRKERKKKKEKSRDESGQQQSLFCVYVSQNCESEGGKIDFQ